MENEIIIDGVNVAECEFYTKGISDFCTVKEWYCADIKDCYFKQLQRLKAENEELKKNKQRLVKMYERFKYTKKANHQYKKQIPRYRQALEEIRNYLKGHKIADEARIDGILHRINEVLQDVES